MGRRGFRFLGNFNSLTGRLARPQDRVLSDAMRFVAGDFRRLSAVVATQAKQWIDIGTKTPLDSHLARQRAALRPAG
jgi:hypothetical protein